MDFITLLLFFIYTWGLGYTATFFLRDDKDPLGLNIMRIGIGLGVIIFLMTLLSLFTLPIDWRVLLVFSMVVPVYSLLKGKIKPNINIKLTKSVLYFLIILVLFFITFYMYEKGANSYPFLEDDDPWGHASSVKYIAEEKVLKEPFEDKILFQYLDTYPPGYDLVLGIIHQTAVSLQWTMRYFNNLIISLGLVFFFFFSKKFIGNSSKALFATFLLFALPSYLTHFIWAHSLVVTLFFPALYCMEMLKKDRLWMIPGAISISAILLTQPTQAAKFGVFFVIYLIIKSIVQKRFDIRTFLTGMYGVLLSLVWWLPKASKFFTENKNNYDAVGYSLLDPRSGTASRAYTFSDFFFAKPYGLINNQPGWGIILSILLFIGLVFILLNYKKLLEKKSTWIFISLGWFIFTFLGVNVLTFNLPIGLVAFRFWMLMAIPVSLLATQGTWFLFGLFNKNTLIKTGLLILIIIGIFFTSFVQKYALNTDPWSPGGGWKNSEELEGYVMLKNLPPNTHVFPFTGTWQAWAGARLIGMDKYFCMWCEDEIAFSDWYDRSPEEVSSFLINKGYEFALVDSHFYTDIGSNRSQIILENFIESGKFKLEFNNGGSAILRVI